MTGTSTVSTLPKSATRLHATALEVRVGNRTLVRDVDLTMASGDVTAVVGRSGVGKTTLLQCLAGILSPHAGTVNVNGTDISQLSSAARARFRLRTIGLIFQHAELLPELPLVENVALPLIMQGSRRAEALAAASELMARLGIGDLAEHRPAQASGGEQQRAAVARAVVHKPALILADEPTGMLDDATSDLVMDQLRLASEQVGAAVVVVTHSDRVAASADQRLRVVDQRLIRVSDDAL